MFRPLSLVFFGSLLAPLFLMRPAWSESASAGERARATPEARLPEAHLPEAHLEGSESPLPQAGFELGVGWLTLPSAEICSGASCTQGDSTPVLELWGLARPWRRWAWGAGATFGFWPTTTIAAEEPALASRSYLVFEATVRYSLLDAGKLRWWLGPGVGVAIVGDRFMGQKLVHNQYVRIGDPGARLATVGPSAFGALALSYAFTKVFHLQMGVRAGGFFFPREPQTTALGDRASVSGANYYLAGGLALLITTPL